MEKLGKKILKTIIEDLIDAGKTDWSEGDLQKWSDWAKRMKITINNSVGILKNLLVDKFLDDPKNVEVPPIEVKKVEVPPIEVKKVTEMTIKEEDFKKLIKAFNRVPKNKEDFYIRPDSLSEVRINIIREGNE